MSPEYSDIEIYISGAAVTALKPSFEIFDDNPDLVALFTPERKLFTNGEYHGDGCDRLDFTGDILVASMDGGNHVSVLEVAEDCKLCAEQYPELNYLVVGSYRVKDDDTVRFDVLFIRGFDSTNNPMKKHHSRFYTDFKVRGI